MCFKFLLAGLQSFGIGLNLSKETTQFGGLLRRYPAMLVKINGPMGDDGRPSGSLLRAWLNYRKAAALDFIGNDFGNAVASRR
jgi:hypothetical protein